MIKEIVKGIILGIGNAIPNASSLHRFRKPFYRMVGIKIGDNTTIVGPINLPVDGKGFLKIGDGTYINALTRFGPNGSGIKIGNQCLIGPRVSFETGGHNIIYDKSKGRGHTSKQIIIEDKVWIGANSVILQGVTIGRESVIAAGSIVTSNVPFKSVWGGVPAKEIKKIEPKTYEGSLTTAS